MANAVRIHGFPVSGPKLSDHQAHLLSRDFDNMVVATIKSVELFPPRIILPNSRLSQMRRGR